jgi:hypothetical protein
MGKSARRALHGIALQPANPNHLRTAVADRGYSIRVQRGATVAVLKVDDERRTEVAAMGSCLGLKEPWPADRPSLFAAPLVSRRPTSIPDP